MPWTTSLEIARTAIFSRFSNATGSRWHFLTTILCPFDGYVKTAKVIKDTYTDEALELMRDSCETVRDLAIIDLLASSGMRVGEMVMLNRDDINFNERECVVFGKGNKERLVYFDISAEGYSHDDCIVMRIQIERYRPKSELNCAHQAAAYLILYAYRLNSAYHKM